MKKFVMTAAALTLGTSALAWAPAKETPLALSSPDNVSGAKISNDGGMTFADADIKSKAAVGGVETASVEAGAKTSNDGGMTFADVDIKSKADVGGVQTASAEAGAKVSNDGGMTFANADIKSKADVGGVQTAAADAETWASRDDSAATGMGGPLEAPMGWRPCDPGPGDDRCIQLYEPGVRPALAAWKATDDNVAMGGPLEPAATGPKPAAPEHQGMNHAASTGTSEAATPAAIGGPVEQRSGYPPCRPGRGDDRCIQLYERGVTGREN